MPLDAGKTKLPSGRSVACPAFKPDIRYIRLRAWVAAHKNYDTSHLSGECKGSSFAVPISSQNGAPKVHTAMRGAFLQSHQYRRRDIRLVERFRIVSESVDVALTS